MHTVVIHDVDVNHMDALDCLFRQHQIKFGRMMVEGKLKYISSPAGDARMRVFLYALHNDPELCKYLTHEPVA